MQKLTVFFYIHFQKRRSRKAKPKTLEQLRAETQLAQEQHKLQRLENRKQYYEKGERQKRTHRLCNLGGTTPSLAPEVKYVKCIRMIVTIRMPNCFTDTALLAAFLLGMAV